MKILSASFALEPLNKSCGRREGLVQACRASASWTAGDLYRLASVRLAREKRQRAGADQHLAEFSRRRSAHDHSFVETALTLTFALAILLGLLVGPAQAQERNPEVLPLWPDGAVESKGLPIEEQLDDRGKPGAHDRRFRYVTEPNLEIFRAEKPSGAGVLIMPGGGYGYVVIDKEGRDVARWFNSIGVTAAVLKYRLPNTATHRFGSEVPLRDAQRALRLLRSHAQEWGVRANRIGAIGFSAGGHLASTIGTHFDAGDPQASDPVDRAGCRPDFLILGYPVISMDQAITHGGSRQQLLGKDPSEDLVRRYSNELQVRSNTPPVFIFCAADDKGVNPENSIRFYQAARAAGVPAELHVFEQGGHGFGLRLDRRAGRTWPGLCQSWLQELLGQSTGEPGATPGLLK